MPKCPKCGKRFDSLSALKNHFKAMHPNERFVAPKATTSRNLVIGLIVIIIVIGTIVGLLITLPHPSSTTTVPQSILGSPINATLYSDLTGVSFATLSSIGSGGTSVSPPGSITSTPLTNGTLPEILYIGAEFCPYCAAERWSLVIALSKFGNFTGLEYMQSAADDPPPAGIPTLTFVNATYISKYISFVSVENEDRNHNTLQVPNGDEETLWQEFNPNAYPFVDIGGQYDLTTAQYSYTDLQNLDWTQIGSQLNNASSPTAQVIDGAANTLIGAICSLTHHTPSDVCDQSYLSTITVAYTAPSTDSASGALQAISVIQPESSAVVSRVGKFTL